LAKSDKIKQPIFLAHTATPPAHFSYISPTGPDQSGTDSNQSVEALNQSATDVDQSKTPDLRGRIFGSEKPRIFTTPLENVGNRLPEILTFAEEIGMKLLPWQINALGEMLTHKDGVFCRRTNILTISRQNGKTELAKLMILAHIYLFGKTAVAGMSSTRNMALTTFRQLDRMIRETPRLKTGWVQTYSTNGNERILFSINGKSAEYRVVAATGDAPRGLSIDFFFVDELRSIGEDVWAAVEYTTQARANSVILAVSNAGDNRSTILNNLRQRGIENNNPSLLYLEWSASPTRSIDDVEGWKEANPALGHLIDVETLRHRIKSSTDTNAVRTEMLCQFIDGNLASPWPVGAWDACFDENMVFEPGPQTFFAVDVAPSSREASLVAGQLDGDKTKLMLLARWTSETALDDKALAVQINDWISKFKPRVLLYDRYTATPIASRLAHVGVPLQEISGQPFAQACSEMLSAMSNKRIAHRQQEELNASINNAAMKTTENGWRIVRRKSAGDVSACCAAAMVVWFANKPQSNALIVV
jgi:phage terminase large subunit-like protein